MTKKLLIFAGPNGSGKSTLYRKLLLKYKALVNLPFVNPDDIAKELFGNFIFDNSKESNLKMLIAGKKAIMLRKKLLSQNRSFGFETTLSGNSEKQIIKEALKNGYELYIIYVSLEDPFLNVQRVKTRVQNNGHFVESKTIVRRYYKSLNNLKEISKFAKGIYLFDNSTSKFRLLASLRKSGARGKKQVIANTYLPEWSISIIENLSNKE